MVATESNRLPGFKNLRALSPRENETKGTEEHLLSDREAYLQIVGWISRQKPRGHQPRRSSFVEIPFIESPISECDIALATLDVCQKGCAGFGA
jgi:hypothetical protein